MADPMAREIATTVSAMDTIDSIVVKWYGDPVGMAEALRDYAQTATPAHSYAWVIKKAHEALNGIEWARDHEPLNRAARLSPDFVG